ncbi:sulfite exporter TauE/SafE family protein [Chitinophaga sp. Hz27]|uniref:sulfite exporter TauE/SafE family protein n=1 Tax=Chitinophaga sp. Hz27 TaxID=3347169 RepID=UPI0035DA8EF1
MKGGKDYLMDFLLQQSNYLPVLIIGLIVGYLSGLLGKGGSAISTPALQIFAGVAPFFALASPLPASITSTLSATAVYRKEKLFNTRVILLSAIIAVPSTIVGSWFSSLLPGKTLMILTAVFIVGIGCSLLFSFMKKKNTATSDAPMQAAVPAGKLMGAAMGIGLLAGLLANAGGILFSSFFIKQLKMPIKQALACAVVLSAILSIPGAVTHWYLGHIDWNIALLLSLTAFPASYLGAKTAVKMKTPLLEKLFALTLILFGLYDIFFTLLHK